jgi:hypothetical protein
MTTDIKQHVHYQDYKFFLRAQRCWRYTSDCIVKLLGKTPKPCRMLLRLLAIAKHLLLILILLLVLLILLLLVVVTKFVVFVRVRGLQTVFVDLIDPNTCCFCCCFRFLCSSLPRPSRDPPPSFLVKGNSGARRAPRPTRYPPARDLPATRP